MGVWGMGHEAWSVEEARGEGRGGVEAWRPRTEDNEESGMRARKAKGLGTRASGQGRRGQGPREKGQGAKGKGKGKGKRKRAMGQRPRAKGQGPRGEGPRSKVPR